MSGQPVRSFWCLVDGDATPFEIDVTPNVKVNRLQEEIKHRKVLLHVDASNLLIWKVSIVYRLLAYESLTLSSFEGILGLIVCVATMADCIPLAP
jgi:hypothetical protein